ncbi:thioredoxin [Cordyceps militaris CM01]|uniref:Thioredoxin n=2 Tax=Cordyceps militaris TaxID=73501 RepID=G3J3E7_CORMM|nr:thioredoxin [Cordyceps militaris CM01]ATY65532.1 thioredoxin [Cordyceps militaris]EGX95677.1 thioredoxin [Cordyceps militaris CM01]
MAIEEITNEDTFHAALKEHKVVVADFHALWCGDCKMIDPFFKKHAADEKFKDVYFCKIDVDVLQGLSKELNVRRMPTFILFKDGSRLDDVFEPKPPQLDAFLAKAL